MYLRWAVAAVLVVAVSGQLCGLGSGEQCRQDLEACTEKVEQKLGAVLTSITQQFARSAFNKAGARVSDFFVDPFHAVQNAIQEDTQTIRHGYQATAAVSRILTNSIRPLLEVLKTAPGATKNPLAVPIELVLETMVILKNFLDDQELRNNTEIENILGLVIPVIQTVNEDGVRCSAEAVGGIMKYPFLLMAFIVGRILDYMLNCYSLAEEAASQLCEIETTVVRVVLGVGIWVLSNVVKLIS